jgi:hypothetical protein
MYHVVWYEIRKSSIKNRHGGKIMTSSVLRKTDWGKKNRPEKKINKTK